MNKLNFDNLSSKDEVKGEQNKQPSYSIAIPLNQSAVQSDGDIIKSFSDCQDMKLSGAINNYSDTQIVQQSITINVRKVKNDGSFNNSSNNCSTLQNFKSQQYQHILFKQSTENTFAFKNNNKKYESLHQKTKKAYLNFQTPANDPLCPTQRENFTTNEIKLLKNYFRYSCLERSNLPKYSTFDEVKIMTQMMGLNEWMKLCKYLNVYQFFTLARSIAQTISIIFKRYENKQKKIDFQTFCKAFGVLIQAMHKYMQQNYNKANKTIIKKYLGISSQKQHFAKLQLMGINCSSNKHRSNENLVNINKPTYPKRTQQTKSTHTQSKQNESNYKLSSIYQTNKQKKSSASSYQKTNQSKSNKSTKIYRKREDRIKSRLFKNLGINNLHKLLPDMEQKQNFQVLTSEDDRFLKQYLKKKKQIKQGILKRLQYKYHQNKVILQSKTHKKSIKQFTKKPNFFVL